jgi:hypothetical protein
VGPFEPKTDPMASDPGRWGHSLGNLAEIWIPVLAAAAPGSVIEVGAYAGDVTRILLDWAQQSGAKIVSIDPDPQESLKRLAASDPKLELITSTSHEALPKLPPADAVIIDGDHNYHTVRQELRVIGDRFQGSEFPLLLLHDVCWPHGRRDAYYAPERIPETDRQPMVEGGAIHPDEPGLAEGGLPYKWVAAREGGDRNGVLTAVEDYVEGREDLRLAIVPAFFGLGVIWPLDARWASSVAEILDKWDSDAIVDRLETNRVYHLAREYAQRPELERLRAKNREKAELLDSLMSSRAFRLADRLSHLRNPSRARSWRDDAMRLIKDD